MKFRLLCLFVCLFLIKTQLFARTESHSWCGTRGPALTEYFLKVHERNRKEITRASELNAVASEATASEAADIGEIAVIKASPLTVTSKNPFDLIGKKIRFTRNSDGTYNIAIGTGAISSTQGSSIPLGDDTSQKIVFSEGFTFPFYDDVQTEVFVNSDGNLTFRKSDHSSLERSAVRTIVGPARISPYFLDLNPANPSLPGTGRGVVNVLQTSKKFIVTWNNVSEYFPTTRTNSNTFQVILYRSGTIDFIYGTTVESLSGVVGISPGKASLTESENVDFSSISNVTSVSEAIWERFDISRQIDYIGLLNEFHATHDHVFDFVVIFTDFGVSIGEPGAFAFYSPIRNNVLGIGQPKFRFTKFVGSRQIQGFLSMGALSKYPDDPTKTFLGTNSTLDVMGQENGHRWGAYITALINGVVSTELLGRDLAHWNFALDTDASELEGNDIQDNGNGTFTTIDATSKYSRLDLYLMGLLPPTSVPPFFFVDNYPSPGDSPEIGVTLTGPRVNVTIDQVIQANGPRVPSSDDAQTEFREAFVLLTNRSVPTSADLQKIDKIRTMWQSFFRSKTLKKATLDTTLP